MAYWLLLRNFLMKNSNMESTFKIPWEKFVKRIVEHICLECGLGQDTANHYVREILSKEFDWKLIITTRE